MMKMNQHSITTAYGDSIDISPIALTDANRSHWGKG